MPQSPENGFAGFLMLAAKYISIVIFLTCHRRYIRYLQMPAHRG
jgi:hypothetical protein